jgi:hypothetical protein
LAPPTPIRAESVALVGPSVRLDPEIHAFRRDLADVALAEQIISSHYAEPLDRALTRPVILRAGPSETAQDLGKLRPGDCFAMLDNSLGWAWGYAGRDRRVGYVPGNAVGPA